MSITFDKWADLRVDSDGLVDCVGLYLRGTDEHGRQSVRNDNIHVPEGERELKVYYTPEILNDMFPDGWQDVIEDAFSKLGPAIVEDDVISL